MRRWLRWLGAMFVVALLCSPGRAGLYNTSESFSVDNAAVRTDPRSFKQLLISLRNLGAPPEAPADALRLRYLMAEWAAPEKLLTPVQKSNLAEVWTRRRKAENARVLLEGLARQNPGDYLIQSNLASVYHLTGLEDRAVATLKHDVLEKWPASGVSEEQAKYLANIGWTEDHPYRFYRQCETYYLKLIELRLREKLKGASRLETVDDLFTDAKGSPVRFVADGGKFEAGKISRDERDKLPKDLSDAVAIVRQLLIWMPTDGRLYRLLGELYNAQGKENVKAAAEVFSDLTHFEQIFNFRSPEVRERREALLSAEVGGDGPMIDEGDLETKIKPPEPTNLIDWRTVGVGFGIGFLAALFVSWQVREWRRKRV